MRLRAGGSGGGGTEAGVTGQGTGLLQPDCDHAADVRARPGERGGDRRSGHGGARADGSR